MALLPGFEYDIFISYRHNDNLDGWVTDFVQQLEKELRSTLKDPVSIYFDKNPHDGLLETHSVDKSLEGKLKCLIFIPIISQTYCDPKSFAWQHEFCAFNKLASADQFGRDVKLVNGNVASRILPVRIHDLDAEDKSLLERELGGVLRSIDFIYKEAGVNRPLRAEEENPTKNQNQTIYRNQINKAANAIKEIITSLKHPVQPGTASPSQLERTGPKPWSSRMVVLAGLAVMAVAAVIYAASQFMGNNAQPEVIDKSVAVLPFVDLSQEHNLEYLGDGVAEEIINVLAQTKDLKVIARSSSFQFKGKNEDLREMGRQLGVSAILEGSIRKFKDEVRVTAQLINVADGSHYWSRNMTQKTENLFEIQDAIAKEVAVALKASLMEGASSKLQKPWNEEAQRLYQQGRFFYDRADEGDFRKSYDLFKQSVTLDSSHGISIAYLSSAYENTHSSSPGHLDSVEWYARMAVKVEPASPEAHAALADVYFVRLDIQRAYNEIFIALENGKASPYVLRTAAYFSTAFGNLSQGVVLARRALEVDPMIARSYGILLITLAANGDEGGMLDVSARAFEAFPQHQSVQFTYAIALAANGQFEEALRSANILKDKTEALAYIYFRQNNKHKLDSILHVGKYHRVSDGWESNPGLEKADYYALLNDPDNFFKVIQGEAISSIMLITLRWLPLYKSMRADPRWGELMKKYDFKEKVLSLQ